MEGDIRGIMNVYYEDYNSANKGNYSKPYCVNCKTYNSSLDFLKYLEDLGFLVVAGQAQGFCAVLVNLELKRCSGIRLACHYTTPEKELDYNDFKPILDKYLKNQNVNL